MKKMLKRLFLLLVLQGLLTFNLSSGGGIILDKLQEERIQEYIHNIELVSKLSESVKEDMPNLAYQDLNSIPFRSPISVTDIQRISGEYGMRKHPIYKDRRFHKGVDFVAPVNTEIFTTADGVVKSIKKSDHGYGNQIVIKHGHGYETRYAHLSEIQVEVGQKVEVNQMIGTLGSSGTVTGPHLHYEIINNNNNIDPMFFSYNDLGERNKDKYISTLMAIENT